MNICHSYVETVFCLKRGRSHGDILITGYGYGGAGAGIGVGIIAVAILILIALGVTCKKRF